MRKFDDLTGKRFGQLTVVVLIQKNIKIREDIGIAVVIAETKELCSLLF